MHRVLRRGMLVAAALAGPAMAQPLTTELDAVKDSPGVDSTTTTQDINFKVDTHDRMTVPVRVAGRGPYSFLVDTGADRTSVSTAMAAQLGLAPGPNARLHSVTGISSVRTASVPQLQLSSNRVRSFDAALLDAGYMGADGILGVDSLRSQRVVFDFKKRVISIVPSAQRNHDEEKGTIVVRGKLKRGHLIVTQARVEHQPAVIVLDTGSEMSVGNELLRRRLASRRLLGTPETIRMISVTGQTLVGDCYYVRELEIGGVKMRNLGIVFANAQIFRSLQLEDKPTVLLGMNAMRAFDKVSIDFERKKLRVLMPEHGMLRDPVMAER